MDVRIETSASGDDPLPLVREAGWPREPGENDRRWALDPEGSFLARAPDGALVGCASVVTWPSDGGGVAWVGGMIVSPRAQRRGVGRALLRRCVEHARARGARVVALYSTPAGRPLYASEGFVERGTSTRWARASMGEAPAPGGRHAIYPISSCEVMDLVAYDKPRFGAGRAAWLAALMARFPERSFVAFDRATGAIAGFAMGQERFLGPVVADDPEAAARLVVACERAGTPGALFVHPHHAAASAWLPGLGYAPEGPTTTLMTLGGPLPGRPGTQVGLSAWALG